MLAKEPRRMSWLSSRMNFSPPRDILRSCAKKDSNEFEIIGSVLTVMYIEEV